MRRRYQNLTIRQKLTLIFLLVTIIMFVIDLFVCMKVNRSIEEINRVYASNVDANELFDGLNDVQEYMYEYLNTRSTEALENYYRTEQDYQKLTENLNNTSTDNAILMLEKNIRNMSDTYLEKTEDTIQEKRGRNVEKYKTSYEETTQLYQYIVDYINHLNNLHFKQNSTNYTLLLSSLKRIEMTSAVLLFCWAAVMLITVYLMTGNIMGPLTRLADTANQVAEGDFEVDLPKTNSCDEVGILTLAFDAMIQSIREYIEQIQTNMENEQQMKEQELLMETHLKDAQLKYLQAQINPHFLFNSLNAGAQLALMEDAEQTCTFVQRMADFFRYNVRKMEEDTTLGEELEAVDNYIYILNVRFAGDIHYECKVDPVIKDVIVPSMILQPIVENSVNHGIRDMEGDGKISLSVVNEETSLFVHIEDNGKGISKERIAEILTGKEFSETEQGDSTGIGLDNVKKRLELYYKKEDLLNIQSDGVGRGTKVSICIPLIRERENNVSNITCG